MPSFIISAAVAASVTLTRALSTNTVAGRSRVMPPSFLNRNGMADHTALAQKAMAYFDSSPDPFHAVETSTQMLLDAGFQELKDPVFTGKLFPGGKYFFTRNKSTLVAFAIGEKYVAGNGFKIIGGHTDSPNLKVKPRSKRGDKKTTGCIQLGVECYGGGLWHTWFDRDLGVSGRVMVRNPQSGVIEQKLVKINRALLRISNLAIHLQTADERAAFKFNKEDHLSPILASEAKNILTAGEQQTIEADLGGEDDDDEDDGWKEHQEPILLQILASELGLDVNDIVDFELNLYDLQCANLGGAYNEFVHSSRLDNLASCFLAVQGLIDHVQLPYKVNGAATTNTDEMDGVGESLLSMDEDISMIALFDHEEVGSSSSTGAGSPIMGEAVRQISTALNAGDGNEDLHSKAIQQSFVLSVDQAHAIHPNYASKHEKAHAPKLNHGMVIKRNNNQRYATNAMTGLIVREIAKKAGMPPIQEFIVRNDCGCGSTIGPIISSNTGIRAIDMGCPQLSMHSIRETMGISDLTHGLNLFRAFFKYFREVDSSIKK